jgi:hypothetical protein
MTKTMKKLNNVLESPSYHLGEAEPGTQTRTAIDQEQLVTDLKSVISNNENCFRLCVGALVVIFSACCVLLYVYRDNTLIMTGLFTVTGISFATITPQMLSFWRERFRTDTVLILARQLPPSETLQMIQLLMADIGH